MPDAPWILRSLLFVPGGRPELIAKAFRLGADALILDLEDSVSLPEKAAARRAVAAALDRGGPEPPLVFVRVNGVTSGLIDLDCREAVRPRANGVVLPKCDTPEQVLAVDARLRVVEDRYAVPRGTLRILALIESARGVHNAAAIARSHPRVCGVALGTEDLTADLGVTRTAEGGEAAYARAAVSLAAHAAGVDAVDGIYAAFRDERGLRADTAEARRVGYTGKLLIHPAQIAPVHDVLAPTAEEVDRARRIAAAFAEAQARGEGIAVVEGAMVDRPVAVRAGRVLAVAARGAGRADAP
jgi:citrate lyase subunit beta / citryl-CoA lyase